MKSKFFLLAFALALVSCNAQETKKDSAVLNDDQTVDNIIPEGSWTVNKEFDERGNMIKYDSIYSYKSATVNGNPIAMKEIDSMMRLFEQNFKQGFSGFDEDSIFNSFFSDSDAYRSFPGMRSRMRYIDSIQKSVFGDFYRDQQKLKPNLENKEPENQKI